MQETLKNQRDERIAALEARLAKPSSRVARPWMAAMGVLMVGYFFAFPLHQPLAYFLSSRTPIVLGTEGAYRWDRLASNRWAEIRGAPTARATFFREKDDTFVVVGLLETPVLVLRHALASEAWSGIGAPPPPDPRSFSTSGRLLARADAPRYAEAFDKLTQMGQVNPSWILIAGERPGGDWTPFFVSTALAMFGTVNLVWLVRSLR